MIGGRSTRLRKQALRDPKYTLKDMLLEGQRAETSAQQAADIEGQLSNQAVNTVRKHSTPQSSWNTNFPPRKSCFKCGGPFPYKEYLCSAKQQACRKRGATGHFAKCCKGKQPTRFRPKSKKETIRGMTQNESADIDHKSDNEITSDSSGDYLYVIHTADPKHPEVFVKVKGSKFKVTVDTDSTIDVIDQDTFKKLQGIKLKLTNVKAYPYNFDKPVEMAGKFDALVETKRRYTATTFYVTRNSGGCLLSSKTAQELGLISLHLNQIRETTKEQEIKVADPELQKILGKHKKVFCGLYKLRGKEIDLTIDPDIRPVAQRYHRVPFYLREKVEKSLNELEQQGIIENVPDNARTNSVSPIVVVPKADNNIHICVDMRAANTAIKRVRHPIPTVKDMTLELNNAKVFSKLDLAQAYHQIPLSKDCQHITIFSMHCGLYRYCRLNYSTNASAELFQHQLQTTLKGIKRGSKYS